MKELLSSVLEGKHTLAIGGHIHPDGDCIGSCVGLYLYLRQEYPELDVDVYLEEIPREFRFLEGTEQVKHQTDRDTPYDLFISLDCGDPGRLGFAEEMFKKARSTFCVDHHLSNDHFAEINYVVPEMSSTSEMIFNLLEEEKISPNVAALLYMGIAHDTGVFFYTCTSPGTMEAAAALMRKGILANEIIDRTYYVKSYLQQKVLGKAIERSALYFGERCIVSTLTKEVLDYYGAGPADLEGIVSQLRNTDGIEVSVFLYALQEREFKLSLRSRRYVDVSKIAQKLGGGGHARAAGATLKGTEGDILKQVLALIKEEILKKEEQS